MTCNCFAQLYHNHQQRPSFFFTQVLTRDKLEPAKSRSMQMKPRIDKGNPTVSIQLRIFLSRLLLSCVCVCHIRKENKHTVCLLVYFDYNFCCLSHLPSLLCDSICCCLDQRRQQENLGGLTAWLDSQHTNWETRVDEWMNGWITVNLFRRNLISR